MLARAALTMAGDDYRCTGVLSPVQALGRDIVEEEVRKFGIDVQTSGRQKGDRWGPASTTRR
jgi:hypothetical protein